MNDEVVGRIVEALREAFGDNLLRISLFGSRARGAAYPWSDYDVLIVLAARNREQLSRAYDLTEPLCQELGADISLKVADEDTFRRLNASALPFWANVRAEQRVLWPNDLK